MSLLHTAVNSLLGGAAADAQHEGMQHLFKQSERPHLTVLFHGSEVHIACIRHEAKPIPLLNNSYHHSNGKTMKCCPRAVTVTCCYIDCAAQSRPSNVNLGGCLIGIALTIRQPIQLPASLY